MRPEAYPHPVDSVELIETHISHLFLAGEFVYKVKKPVNLGFCDFTTPALRRHFTERELELNQRLASGVYMGVSEVRVDATGRYMVDGKGEPAECALKMRRLSADDSLDAMILRGEAEERDIRLIARRIAEFHKHASISPAGARYGSPEVVSGWVLDTLERAERATKRFIDRDLLADVRGFCEAFLDVHRSAIEGRRAGGHVREVHGDLHTANIFLEQRDPGSTPVVQVIDCIEFNDELRVIDTAADIAFLVMDLERLGRPDLTKALTDEYATASGDQNLMRVLPFYAVYRAMVRCMASGMMARSEKQAGERRTGFIDEARTYARLAAEIPSRERPQILVVMSGPTGSGKSTVARLLAERWGLVHLQTDVIRKRLAGLDPMTRTTDAVRTGLYSPEMSARTYRELERQAELSLTRGESVVMDGTFIRRQHRRSAVDIGRRADVPVIIAACAATERETLSRLAARYASGLSVSDGRPEVYLAEVPHLEQVRDSEADAVARVDTSGEEAAVRRRALASAWRATLIAKRTGRSSASSGRP